MSAASPVTPPAPALSHGLAIEYKAFARSFTQDAAVGVLYLTATCSYPISGFTIFFEGNGPGKFKLMEQPPSGVFLNLVTYYVASWPPTGVSALGTVPAHVVIEDAQGEHTVHVKPWN